MTTTAKRAAAVLGVSCVVILFSFVIGVCSIAWAEPAVLPPGVVAPSSTLVDAARYGLPAGGSASLTAFLMWFLLRRKEDPVNGHAAGTVKRFDGLESALRKMAECDRLSAQRIADYQVRSLALLEAIQETNRGIHEVQRIQAEKTTAAHRTQALELRDLVKGHATVIAAVGG